MKDIPMGDYRKSVNPQFFDTLANTHPVRRRHEIKDPRNDKDYDTFEYGTEPLPGDRNWASHCTMSVGMAVVPTWRDNCRPIQNPDNR